MKIKSLVARFLNTKYCDFGCFILSRPFVLVPFAQIQIPHRIVDECPRNCQNKNAGK